MTTLAEIYPQETVGELTMFDRVVMQGHLSGLYAAGGLSWLLRQEGVEIRGFGEYAQKKTDGLKAHMQEVAKGAGRPIVYMNGGKAGTKEEKAREIAREDGVVEGLVCVLSALEMGTSFEVKWHKEQKRAEIKMCRRKSLHYYLYYLDKELGWMYVRLQSWLPYGIQVYFNGREWLARQLDKAGLGYERHDNCFVSLEQVAAAQTMCDKFAHREWPRLLDAFAGRLNPHLGVIERVVGKGYYWSINQCEVATDVMFADEASLTAHLPQLYQEALLIFSAQDVMRFLGRKLHPNYQGEVKTNLNKRSPGWRVKHWAGGNSLKMYNKGSVLRVETTVNQAREFRVLVEKEDGSQAWTPLKKGVQHFWHFYQVCREANQRYLTALQQLPLQDEAVQALDSLCQSQVVDGQRVAKFHPVAQADGDLFAAVMAGDHYLTGFRNHDLLHRLYHQPSHDPQESKRRCARISRLIAKLRHHRLITRIEHSRLYRVTQYGFKVMAAALTYRQLDFPAAFAAA